MRRSVSTALLAAFATGTLILTPSLMRSAGAELPPGGTFVDDDGSVHEGYIEALVAAQITVGCAPNEFCPTAAVTRGQMASFLVRALDLPAASGDYFVDDDGTTHEQAANALRQAGITVGCDATGTRFCPAAPITRGQLASLLVNAFDLPPATSDDFDDDNGSVHEPAINALREAGYASGCGARAYCEQSPTSRAQMASFLGRALGLTPTAPPTDANDPPVNTVPSGMSVLYGEVVPVNGIAVADADIGGATLQLTLRTDTGAILEIDTTVAGGVTDVEVTGNFTSSVVITAPLAAINTTLGDPYGLVLDGPIASGVITVESDDLGSTGAGGAQIDTDTIPVTVA